MLLQKGTLWSSDLMKTTVKKHAIEQCQMCTLCLRLCYFLYVG